MPEPHEVLNALDARAAEEALRKACGAQRWVQRMLALRPFASTEALLESARREWDTASPGDWLEAFAQHPQIGEDLGELERRYAPTAALSAREQAGVQGSSASTLLALRDANRAYRERFGFIFIICATGKTASQILEALTRRLQHERAAELSIAAAEQAEITHLRLKGLAA